MGPIAKGFVQGMSAAAQSDGRSSGQIEGLSFRVVNRKLAFDFNRAVIVDNDLRWHSVPMLTRRLDSA